ncbi:hypothetical protein RI054_04g21700 [Pseudoscourfieldia marina]
MASCCSVHVGTVVTIEGLVAAPQHNGAIAVVEINKKNISRDEVKASLAFNANVDDPNEKRVTVRVLGNKQPTTILNVRRKNLHRICAHPSCHKKLDDGDGDVGAVHCNLCCCYYCSESCRDGDADDHANDCKLNTRERDFMADTFIVSGIIHEDFLFLNGCLARRHPEDPNAEMKPGALLEHCPESALRKLTRHGFPFWTKSTVAYKNKQVALNLPQHKTVRRAHDEAIQAAGTNLYELPPPPEYATSVASMLGQAQDDHSLTQLVRVEVLIPHGTPHSGLYDIRMPAYLLVPCTASVHERDDQMLVCSSLPLQNLEWRVMASFILIPEPLPTQRFTIKDLRALSREDLVRRVMYLTATFFTANIGGNIPDATARVRGKVHEMTDHLTNDGIILLLHALPTSGDSSNRSGGDVAYALGSHIEYGEWSGGGVTKRAGPRFSGFLETLLPPNSCDIGEALYWYNVAASHGSGPAMTAIGGYCMHIHQMADKSTAECRDHLRARGAFEENRRVLSLDYQAGIYWMWRTSRSVSGSDPRMTLQQRPDITNEPLAQSAGLFIAKKALDPTVTDSQIEIVKQTCAQMAGISPSWGSKGEDMAIATCCYLGSTYLPIAARNYTLGSSPCIFPAHLSEGDSAPRAMLVYACALLGMPTVEVEINRIQVPPTPPAGVRESVWSAMDVIMYRIDQTLPSTLDDGELQYDASFVTSLLRDASSLGLDIATRIVQGSRMAEIEAGTFRLSYPEELAKVSFEAGTWKLAKYRRGGMCLEFEGRVNPPTAQERRICQEFVGAQVHGEKEV